MGYYFLAYIAIEFFLYIFEVFQDISLYIFPELWCVFIDIDLHLYFKKIFLLIGACSLGTSSERLLLGTWQWAEPEASWETVSGDLKRRKETAPGTFIKGGPYGTFNGTVD